MTQTCFIADLHLHPARATIIDLLLRFLEKLPSGETDGLYILGDLFEAWIGDDDDDPVWTPLIDALAALEQRDIPLYLMHGNRDFLMGEQLARRCGATLLEDPCVIDLYGQATLLMHGDTLCTDDSDYQAFRRQVRSPEWQRDFLGKSLGERREIAAQLRETSRQAGQEKPAAIMDVNQQAVAAIMREHQVRQLIHGHTHRPAMHHFELDGQPATRMVLGDWYQQGSCLLCDPKEQKLESLAAD